MTAKEYLYRYRQLNAEIDSLEHSKNELKGVAYKITPQPSDVGIPNSSSASGARFESVIAKIAGIEDRINEKIDQLIELRDEITTAIDSVDDATMRTLLRLRYICGWEWEKIARKINYSDVHTRGYLHGAALNKVNTP